LLWSNRNTPKAPISRAGADFINYRRVNRDSEQAQTCYGNEDLLIGL